MRHDTSGKRKKESFFFLSDEEKKPFSFFYSAEKRELIPVLLAFCRGSRGRQREGMTFSMISIHPFLLLWWPLSEKRVHWLFHPFPPSTLTTLLVPQVRERERERAIITDTRNALEKEWCVCACEANLLDSKRIAIK